MRDWVHCWRFGLAPSLPTAGLVALLRAVREDDPRLTQGATTVPPPLICVQEWPCEGGDAVAFCGWQGADLGTVGEVERFWADAAHDADRRLGADAACRAFFTWFDDTPRPEMLRDLEHEIRVLLAGRDEPAGADEPALVAAGAA